MLRPEFFVQWLIQTEDLKITVQFIRHGCRSIGNSLGVKDEVKAVIEPTP